MTLAVNFIWIYDKTIHRYNLFHLGKDGMAESNVVMSFSQDKNKSVMKWQIGHLYFER